MFGFLLLPLRIGLLYRVDIFLLVFQNDRAMANRSQFLEERIQSIKREIAALGDLRPGALSLQYNVCGSPGCQCKAIPPLKHGPYYKISVNRHGKSSSHFVREDDLKDVQQQLENYRRLQELVDEWITLSAQLSTLRLKDKHRSLGPVHPTGPNRKTRRRP